MRVPANFFLYQTTGSPWAVAQIWKYGSWLRAAWPSQPDPRWVPLNIRWPLLGDTRRPSPTSGECGSTRALARLGKGQLGPEIAEADRLLALDPASAATAHHVRSMAYNEKSDPDRALDDAGR